MSYASDITPYSRSGSRKSASSCLRLLRYRPEIGQGLREWQRTGK